MTQKPLLVHDSHHITHLRRIKLEDSLVFKKLYLHSISVLTVLGTDFIRSPASLRMANKPPAMMRIRMSIATCNNYFK